MLKRLGFDISVLTYYPHDFFLPLLIDAGIYCHCIETSSLVSRILAIRRILRRGNQDVVLAFLDGPVFYAELAAIPRRKWGLVVSERNAIPSTAGTRRARLRQFHRIADYVTTNSHTNRLIIERDVPSLKDRLVTIYNTVDLEAFSPSPKPQVGNARQFRIVVAASYWPQKNPARFIEGIAIARARLPDVDIQLDWYGKSPRKKGGTAVDTAIFDETSRMVRLHELEHCIRLNPDRASIQDAYREADAVALPSLYEGLPNTICEAMACGRPILLSNVCDAGNLVREGYNGFLFDPTSPEDMATAIVRLASTSPSEREVFGVNSREMAERLLNPAIIAANYAKVLTAAASRQKLSLQHWVSEVPDSAYKSST